MIDLERCIGCKSCEAACKTEHGLGPGENHNRVIWLGSADAPALDFLTLSCQHCERPACLRACPVTPKAITKDPDTGVVSVDESRCTGCGECVVACPYGAMGYDAIDHHAVKCDLCGDRRAEGLRPACATVCPGEAITFGERDEHLKKAADEGRSLVDHDAFLLGPSNLFLERTRGGAREFAQPDTTSGGQGFSMKSRHRPAVVDDPKRRKAIEPKAVSFPFRSRREDRKADTVVAGGCNICFNCCSTEYHLKDGKVVGVTGNEADPLWRGKVCPKSQFLLQLYNSNERLTRPLKRVGARGEGRFEPIGWDQALDEIAAKLDAIRTEHGAEALGIFAGTRTGTLTRKGYIRLFTQLWGTPNFADTEPFCSEAKFVAFEATMGLGGSGNSYTPDDLGSAALYVYIGDNQAESRPVHFGMINNWRLKNGARMIAVDPRLTVTASKADLWLPISAGTDMALALALAHHILEAGLHDLAFCDQWVLGWQEWRDYIVAKDYSPDWAAPITGIDAEQIRALAEEIASADGCVIFGARGINQHSNGTQSNRALLFLAAITGNIGRKGGAYFNFGTPTPVVANAPQDRRATVTKPMAGGTNPTSWLNAMLANDPYPMRAIITANNPLTAWPNQSRVRAAFESLDLLVHVELFKNDTSAYADYILPAATGVEKGEIGRASEDRRIVWIDKVIDPPGEAKPDGWIWIELGKRFGYGDVLKEEYKDSALFWDEMCINDPSMRGCTQKRLHSVPWRWVRAPLPDEAAEEVETLHLEGTTAHGRPEGHRFPTPSGKLEFWTEALEARFKVLGLSALPEFYSDTERLVEMPYVSRRSDNAGAVRNPFMRGDAYTVPVEITQPNAQSPRNVLAARGFDTELITGRPPAPHFHSWTHYAWQAQEMWPDLYVQMHPSKAQKLGIGDGQIVHIETAYGRIQARAWLFAGIREDAVYVPIGWDASQPFHPWKSVNFLTDERQRDPVSDHSNLKSYLCRVTPADGFPGRE
ncbi:MAG: molybdopterin-dependent oxidoreductase [Aquisalimonadaceae bacterium]